MQLWPASDVRTLPPLRKTTSDKCDWGFSRVAPGKMEKDSVWEIEAVAVGLPQQKNAIAVSRAAGKHKQKSVVKGGSWLI